MELKIDKNYINNINFLNFLHDKTVGKINIKNDFIEFLFWDIFRANEDPRYKMIIHLGKKTTDFVNVYLYKIDNGIISGKLSEISDIVDDDISFELYDSGYCNSILFFKGSIIKNNMLNRDNILLEFCFENIDSFIEIKDII